jgi:hypothetical protein
MNSHMHSPADYIRMVNENHWFNIVVERDWWWKMVVTNKEDFDEAVNFVAEMHKEAISKNMGNQIGHMIKFAISPAWGLVFASDIYEWISKSEYKQYLNLNLQIHKIIWPSGEQER